jgi:hypothetical protein
MPSRNRETKGRPTSSVPRRWLENPYCPRRELLIQNLYNFFFVYFNRAVNIPKGIDVRLDSLSTIYVRKPHFRVSFIFCQWLFESPYRCLRHLF